MKLMEALKIIHGAGASSGRPGFHVLLNCGFTPLHLETFLKAHLIQSLPDRSIQVSHGLYGDLAGNIERMRSAQTSWQAAVVMIEWADLDPRLGVRVLGGWQPAQLPGILQSAQAQLRRITEALLAIPSLPVVVSPPTLPVPPLSYAPPRQLSFLEAGLRLAISQFVDTLLQSPSGNIRVVNPQLPGQQAASARFDIKSELLTGFPYELGHAGQLAALLAAVICNQPRKKGIITDLDDTLWLGILGETGVSGVCWDLDGKAQLHGLYQQMLSSLAAAGTLIGVASKNDPHLVAEVFQRSDIILSTQSIFPMEVHWNNKSQSVERILAAWNVAANAVVFIDDSPMELAEVKAAFPDVDCILFPKNDPARLWELLFELRAMFGVGALSAEDSLRLDSLRSRTLFQTSQSAAGNADEFLRGAEAEITLSTDKQPDRRAFELINKTNQFNLNGKRIAEAEWNELLEKDQTFLLKVSYKDRYGPLGTIAVLAGSAGNHAVTVHHWVMSCRAFSRRIEHRCLEWLFDQFGAGEVWLHFAPTPRNGPTQEFLAGILGHAPQGEVRIPRQLFEQKCPSLFHSVVHSTRGDQ